MLKYLYFFLLIILSNCIGAISWANQNSYLSILSELPYGIELGATKNIEIEKRGNCISKIKTSNNSTGAGHERCERYDMAGKFQIFSSHAEVINKIVFANHMGHNLPRKWRQIGLDIGIEGKVQGTDFETFRHLIRGANNIKIRSDSGNDLIVHFEIGNQFYEAEFWKQDSSPTPDKDQDTFLWRKGLFRIVVTENY